MSLDAVHEIIQQAKASELKTSHTSRWLDQKMATLHRVVALYGNDPVQDLTDFVVDYIELAPHVLECVAISARESQQSKLFAPFIDTSLEYFIHPSVIVLQHTGLDCLLIMAYQSHRLIEELYDHNASLRNSPLCDISATQANLLAHQLIGEPFANEIDEATSLALRSLVNLPDYYHLDLDRYLAISTGAAWSDLNRRWQNLLSDHHIRLCFSPPDPTHVAMGGWQH